MNARWLLLASAFLFSFPRLAAPAGYKLEKIGACTSSDVAEAMRATLQPEGYRVVGDAGTVCEVWMRKTIPQKKGSTGADYSTLANGTFVGVITYPAKAGDYRGQTIRPGTYTLRYQTIPSDGNHLGVSPGPEFFLLAPASADKDPAAVIESQELIKLSKQASGTNHPHPLNLTAPTAGGNPTVRETEARWALEAKTKAQPQGGGAEADFPFAIILVGKAEG